jgi:hypothetical protein
MRTRPDSAVQSHALLYSSVLGSFFAATLAVTTARTPTPKAIDFNRDIRPILAENCLKCHGPDDEARKAKLRFDLQAEARKPAKSGNIAIVPGAPEKSELISRITASDPDDLMPPPKTGKKLTPAQIQLLRAWISQGAPYAAHWSYVKPNRPALPSVKSQRWARNAIDRFILARLEKEHLKPSPEADRYTLIRRLSLDLTGLPPSVEEADQFVKDRNPSAYENLVDRLLAKPSFGEHWARLWLDLARYADSAGYADDPPRTIWAYRDYVIKAFNANKPFDRFTVEQIAGDLLDDADDDVETGTAFHRNTMTNNEGGTSDEEFRNAAVVDRVNTTMSVWMATSMGCAQCHTHKYDPISQREYFQFFAFFNNTEDADLKDESPLFDLYTPEQKQQLAKIHADIAKLEKTIKTSTPALVASETNWETHFPVGHEWLSLKPAEAQARDGGSISIAESNTLKIAPQQRAELYTIRLPLQTERIAGVRIEALPSPAETGSDEQLNRSYLITHVAAKVISPETNHLVGRFVRVEIPGREKILSLAEVQVFSGGKNLAPSGSASQSSTAYDGAARLAIDGNVDGNYEKAKSTTHTEASENPWWEVDLKAASPIDRIVVWNRTDHELQSRLKDFKLSLLDNDRQIVWESTVHEVPTPSATLSLHGSGPVDFAAAFADSNRSESDPKAVIAEAAKGKKKGWAVEPNDLHPHSLTLLPARPFQVPPGSKLEVKIDQFAERVQAPSALIRISASEDPRLAEYAAVPENILDILTVAPPQRTDQQSSSLSAWYRANVAPELKTERQQLAKLKKNLADIIPNTVPIMRELAGDKRRKTHIQLRGNYLSLSDEVSEGVPAAFPPLPKSAPLNRLTVARWLVSPDNPLTPRVIANRVWEQIFGVGIVRTSEDFGTQGDRPTHPELLDWLACELRDGPQADAGHPDTQYATRITEHSAWNLKNFLRLLVTSAAYRQSSRVTPELQERDPDNLLLARGPRFRAPAEVVRDQALAVSGLLSTKMYGPPVRPPQPSSGLAAAFGGSLDWKPSEGEDRYRRALYTEWRRTSPYPSMATFDAPNREVCALRRPRSNTPLQALVTLNDPVFVENAQALGRRMAELPGSRADKARLGFRLCLIRPPAPKELNELTTLFETASADYAKHPDNAKKLVGESKTEDIQQRSDELAAWTAVANVLLNLDETLMRP